MSSSNVGWMKLPPTETLVSLLLKKIGPPKSDPLFISHILMSQLSKLLNFWFYIEKGH